MHLCGTYFSKHLNSLFSFEPLDKTRNDETHTTDSPPHQQGAQWLSSHLIKSHTKAKVQMLALHNYQSHRISQLMNPRCREGKEPPRPRPHDMLSCHITKAARHRVLGFSSELGLRTLDAGCPPARSFSSGGHSAQKVAAKTNLSGAGGGPPAAPTEGSG